jgi:hypothetical protein
MTCSGGIPVRHACTCALFSDVLQGLLFVGKWAGESTVVTFDVGHVLLSGDVSIRVYMFESDLNMGNTENLQQHAHKRYVYMVLLAQRAGDMY